MESNKSIRGRPRDSFVDIHVKTVKDHEGNVFAKNCKYCGHIFSSKISVTRIKAHLGGITGHDVAPCRNVPRTVQLAARNAFAGSGSSSRPSTPPHLRHTHTQQSCAHQNSKFSPPAPHQPQQSWEATLQGIEHFSPSSLQDGENHFEDDTSTTSELTHDGSSQFSCSGDPEDLETFEQAHDGSFQFSCSDDPEDLEDQEGGVYPNILPHSAYKEDMSIAQFDNHEINFNQCSNVQECIHFVDPLLSTPRVESPKLLLRLHCLFWRFCWVPKCPQNLVRTDILNQLSLDKTAIDELPPYIENLVALKKLYMQKCENIRTLPNSIYRMQSLQRISLDGCSMFNEFPKYADGSSSSPSTQKPLSFPKWTYMDLQGCCLREINFINDLDCISTLKNLDLSGNKLVRIPECVCKSTALQQLNLGNCKQLREILGLPPNLKNLSAKGCESLEWYMPLSRMLKSHPINSPQFRQIDFSGCDKLSQGDYSLANFFSIEDLILDSQIKILHPGSEIPKWFRYKREEGSIPFSVDSELYQNIDGLAFCMIIGLEGRERSEVSFSCQVEVFINHQRIYSYMDFFKCLGSDHMWLMYVPSPMICGWDIHMQNQCNEFMVLLESSKDALKCCGVHPILKKDRQAIRRTNFFDTSDSNRPMKRIKLIQ